MIQFIEVPVLVYSDEQLALIQAGVDVDENFKNANIENRFINVSQIACIAKDQRKESYTVIDMSSGDSIIVAIEFENFIAKFQNEG